MSSLCSLFYAAISLPILVATALALSILGLAIPAVMIVSMAIMLAVNIFEAAQNRV
jgi:hypothetical protein